MGNQINNQLNNSLRREVTSAKIMGFFKGVRSFYAVINKHKLIVIQTQKKKQTKWPKEPHSTSPNTYLLSSGTTMMIAGQMAVIHGRETTNKLKTSVQGNPQNEFNNNTYQRPNPRYPETEDQRQLLPPIRLDGKPKMNWLTTASQPKTKAY